MRKGAFLTALLLLCGIAAPAAIAQQPDPGQAAIRNSVDLNRAKNYARQTAERTNGGLNNYRAEFAMHGPAVEAPYVTNPDGSWTFTFAGTLFGPTESQDTQVETSVRVTPDGQVELLYNRPAF